MPIRFRCGYCSRLLGIARRKAGSNTTCPHCGATIAVPMPDQPEGDDEEQPDLDDIDVLLNADRPAVTAPASSRSASESSATPTPAPSSAPTPASPRSHPAPKSAPAVDLLPLPEDENPLFERDVDSVPRGKGAPPARHEERKPNQGGTADLDAMSLDTEPGDYVLSRARVRVLLVGVAVLLGLAFAAGYFIGSR